MVSPQERVVLVRQLAELDRRLGRMFRERLQDTREFYSLRDQANAIRTTLQRDDYERSTRGD